MLNFAKFSRFFLRQEIKGTSTLIQWIAIFTVDMEFEVSLEYPLFVKLRNVTLTVDRGDLIYIMCKGHQRP